MNDHALINAMSPEARFTPQVLGLIHVPGYRFPRTILTGSLVNNVVTSDNPDMWNRLGRKSVNGYS